METLCIMGQKNEILFHISSMLLHIVVVVKDTEINR
jgi:hypothetical protein